MARTPSPKERDKDKATANEPGWLRGTLQALFVRQVRVRRVDGKVTVALDQADAAAAAGDKTAGKAQPHGDAAMRAELKALLNTTPDSRTLLRVLGAVEHGLKHKDAAGLFLFDVDAPRLRTALRQLDGLMPREPGAGLVKLRARMVEALAKREQREKRLEMMAPRSDLLHSSRLEVNEARPSDFDRASEQWKGKDPATT